MAPAFVDCHSHVVPADDDGAKTLPEGLALCCGAAAHGTRVLFATPHVWPQLPLTSEREEQIRAAFAELERAAPLDVRLGFELTPTVDLLDEDPRRYALSGTDAVLMEVPFHGSAELVVALAEHVEAAGLRPVIAHPERTDALLDDPALARSLVARGWLLQVNGTSLLGRHSPEAQALGWRLVEDGLASLVASDGHRETRPPHLDDAYAAVRARIGEQRARPLFDGSALGLVAAGERGSAAA